MPFADDPVWIDGLSYSSAELRRAQAMGLMANGVAGGSLGGVRPGDPGLLVSLSGMGITVAAGVAAVPYAGQGVYRAYNSSAWTGTVATAHASLTRIDLVYLRVWDNTVDASGLAQGDVVYLAGTAGSGVAPTPSGTQVYITLASITVPPGSTTPSVTDLRPYAIAPGGITPGGAVAGYYTGQYRDNPTTGLLERYSGSSWGPPEQPMVGVNSSGYNLGSSATAYGAITYTSITSSNRGGMWSSGQASRILAPLPGTYELGGVLSWPSQLGSADGRAEFRLNGSGTGSATARWNTIRGSSGNSSSVASGTVIFTSAGYLEVYANQNSGNTVSLIASVTMRRISAATS